jgi:putative Holliday junction resolvase
MRFLALDVGERRIGLAYGDTDVKITTPQGALVNDENVLAELANIIERLRIDQLVIGLPRNSRGEETKQSAYVREFSAGLASLGRPIVFQDESLTSVLAEENLARRGESPRHKSAVDAEAATIILSDFLEAYVRK